MPELPLDAPEEVLERLANLLPHDFVEMRQGEAQHTFTRFVAVRELRKALSMGIPIDLSNGEGPLEEWDGWLVIASAPQLYIRTNWKCGLGQKTEDPHPVSRVRV